MAMLLEFNNLGFLAGGREVEVSGTVYEGGILNLCGPSGSGKTTLLRILARLKAPSAGQVMLEGRPWTEFPPVSWRRRVFYLAQKPAVFDGTVRDNLVKPFELKAVRKDLEFNGEYARQLMERLYLPGKLMDQDARTLSGGEASRMALVRALLVEPSLILLDEPLAALDRQAAAAALGLVAEWVSAAPGRGAVLVSHVGDMSMLPCLSVLELEKSEGENSE